MRFFTHNDLRQLIDVHSNVCMSLFMPSSPLGAQSRESVLHLKNLLKQAEKQLLDTGIRGHKLEEFLQPARQLLNDNAFWEQQSNGLAIFLTEREFYYYRLPIVFDELLYIDDRLFLKPLVPMLTATGRYFIMALSLHDVRVFEANRFNIRRLKIMNLPQNMDEALEHHKIEKELQFHTRTNHALHGRRASIFHGHGTLTDEIKKEVELFLRRVDHAVCRALDFQRVPLVIAGVDHIVSAYKANSRYHTLLEEALLGNPDRIRPDEFHRLSWPLVKQQFERDELNSVGGFHRFRNVQKSTDDLESILTLAFHGEVDTLFLKEGCSLWGLITPDARFIETHNTRRDTDKDLCDEAAYQTLSHSGRVFVLPPNKMPTERMMAANLRIKHTP